MIRTDTIANNLANVDTTGFKQDLSVFRTNNPMAIHRVDDQTLPTPAGPVDPKPFIGFMPNGALWERNYIDFSQGSLRLTGNPLDVAITGPDFLAVNTPNGIQYTRDGALRRNANGALVDVNGYGVLNTQNKPIVLGDGPITISEDGQISVGGEVADQLQRVTLPQNLAIQKVGDNFYQYAGPVGPPRGTVEQGFLEGSNANAILEMVRLIEAERAYQTSSRALASEDTALQSAVTDVGRSTR